MPIDSSAVACRKCGTRLRRFPVHCCNIHYITPDECGQVIDRSGPCAHRGEETRREQCSTCKSKVELKIFSCAIHGECSLAAGSTVKHCGTCKDYARYRKPSILHCCYHVCALKTNDLWLGNIRQLLKRKDMFTGKRIAAIAVGENIHLPRVVKREFAGSGFQFIERPNDRNLREVVTFVPMLQQVESTSPDEAVFFAHTKGNATAGSELGAMYWRNAMYHHLLDRADECMEKLTKFPCVGTHKMIFGRPERAPYPSKLRHGVWMFAGTFFWFRSDAVFSHPKWRDIPKDRYGAEAWLSGLFGPEEGYSMFQPWAEQKYPTPNPYQPELYKNPIADPCT